MNAEKSQKKKFHFVFFVEHTTIEGKSEVRMKKERMNRFHVKRRKVFLALDNLECTQFMDL